MGKFVSVFKGKLIKQLKWQHQIVLNLSTSLYWGLVFQYFHVFLMIHMFARTQLYSLLFSDCFVYVIFIRPIITPFTYLCLLHSHQSNYKDILGNLTCALCGQCQNELLKQHIECLLFIQYLCPISQPFSYFLTNKKKECKFSLYSSCQLWL